MNVSDDVHIEISSTVRDQLRGLEPAKRETIVAGLYGSLAVDGRPIRLAGSKYTLYVYKLEHYAFFFRELTRRELDRNAQDFGYYVFDMIDILERIKRRLGYT